MALLKTISWHVLWALIGAYFLATIAVPLAALCLGSFVTGYFSAPLE